MKTTLIPLLLLSQASLAYQAQEIKFKIHPEMADKLNVELEIKSGILRNISKQSLNFNPKEIETSLSLTSLTNIKAIDYKIQLKSNSNVIDQDIQSVDLVGRFVMKGNKEIIKSTKSKRDKLNFHNDIKFNPKLDCGDTVKISEAGSKTLLIDLSHINNLGQCQGKDIEKYSLNYVQNRNLDQEKNHFSLEDDFRLGKEFADKFNRENANILLPLDHPMSIYMQKEMERIAKVSDRPDIKPVVRVINADVLNAFALPGGYIYVFRGLLEKAPTFNAVMGILGHEWAHVTARHGTKGVTRAIRAYTRGAILALGGILASEIIFRNRDGGQSEQDQKRANLRKFLRGTSLVAGVGGAHLYVLDRGRKQELEADRLGAQYAALAGYSPSGIAEMFREFKRLAPRNNVWLENILSTHPHHDQRIEMNLIQSALFMPPIQAPLVYKIETDQGEILYQDALAQLSSLPLPSKEESEAIGLSFMQAFSDLTENELLEHI